MRLIILFLLAANIAPSALAADSSLYANGVGLDIACLSDDEGHRSACFDRVEAMLDAKPQAQVTRCYIGQLLNLRNASLHGYRELLEMEQWLESPDGRARTAAHPEAVASAMRLISEVGPSRDTIRQARQTGRFPLTCRVASWLWSD